MKDIERAKALLAEGNTCAICKGEEICVSTLRGVKPLVLWIESKKDFSRFSVADKVVGKGASFLYLLLGVKELYAGIISRVAYELLLKNGISVQYGRMVENIINRAGTGICPFEEAVLDIEDIDRAYAKIREKMREMGL